MQESEYGRRLRSKGISFLSKGRSMTHDQVKYGRDKEGNRVKATTDELGNVVVEHNNKKDQVDVHIKAPHIKIGAQEVRE